MNTRTTRRRSSASDGSRIVSINNTPIRAERPSASAVSYFFDWTDGERTVKAAVCPGPGWRLGSLNSASTQAVIDQMTASLTDYRNRKKDPSRFNGAHQLHERRHFGKWWYKEINGKLERRRCSVCPGDGWKPGIKPPEEKLSTESGKRVLTVTTSAVESLELRLSEALQRIERLEASLSS